MRANHACRWETQEKTPAADGGRYTTSVRIALFALNSYKAYISFWFAGSCRFEPTCSRYMYEAIVRFGVLRGVWLGTKRLLRCQPLSRKFGFDPVPEKWEEMPANAAVTRDKTVDSTDSMTGDVTSNGHKVRS
jgi:putative membrane protein insertion efficiency factor